ncbi:MAG: cysteine--tRNA ligase [Desulfurococcales archaeon]|nr:cysteine--tRNA ligase [Desulfurococcales archaeon]
MPEIKVKNTLGRRLETFRPENPPQVSMYVCGPTVYDYTHIGHARTYVVFDAIKRYLSLKGFDVFHIQNITDIDDKIIDRAKAESRDWHDIVEEYTRDYMEQIEKLGIHVDLHPRVTHHINEIIEFIQGLIDKGHAYVAPSGSVYFSVDTYDDYGALSGRISKELWGQEEEFISEKKSPYDFALWKSRKPGEPYWNSPWGPGRPGWHIECSVMSTRYTGESLDIHGGGSDLIFPHHENERAQSETFLGKRPWVKYWLHTGMLLVSGEKMSKSLGNIIPLKEALGKWGPHVLRLWLLSAYYRSPLDYTETGLEQAQRLHERLVHSYQVSLRRVEKLEPSYYLDTKDIATLKRILDIRREWDRELSNDFNFGAAMRWLWELTGVYYKEVEHSESNALLALYLSSIEDMNSVYYFMEEAAARGPIGLENQLIDLIVEVRKELRKKKMYDLADHIRRVLGEMGIKLMDKGEETEWVKD